MTVYELMRNLVEHEPNAEVEFNLIPQENSISLDIDEVEMDGDKVIIPQHSIGMKIRNIVWFGDYNQCGHRVVINLKSDS